MNMTLPEFILSVGDAVFAERFGVPVRTAQSWRRRERLPRPEQAREIVRISDGQVTFDGIYADPANTDEPVGKVA